MPWCSYSGASQIICTYQSVARDVPWMRPEAGGCAELRRSRTARTKVVHSARCARRTRCAVRRRPSPLTGLPARVPGRPFDVPGARCRVRLIRRGARPGYAIGAPQPLDGTADAQFSGIRGCGHTHTGAVHSGKIDLLADWGAFHDTNARPEPPGRGSLRAGGRRYPCPRLGRDPGTHAGTALRGGVRPARSRGRHPDAVARLWLRARPADRGGPGAQVTGVDSDRERLALARARLLPEEGAEGAPAHRARLHESGLPRAPARTGHRTT